MTAGFGLAIGVVAIVGVIVAAVTQSLLVDEARAWLPHLSRWLVQRAAHRLPEEQRERYQEEWLAELASWSDRPISAVARAAHIRWRSRAMRLSLDGYDQQVPAIDRLLAGVALACLWPLIGLIAVAIRLGSPGPVLWWTATVEPNGPVVPNPVTFRTFTLETCHVIPVDDVRGAVQTGADLAARVTEASVPVPTRLGRVLSRLSLDRLPALVAVARGHHRLRPARNSMSTHPDARVFAVVGSDAMARGGLRQWCQGILARLKA